MESKYSKYSHLSLWILFILGGVGYYWAFITGAHHKAPHVEGEHYKILNRSLVLLIAVGPSAIYSLFGKSVKSLLRFSIAIALMSYFIITDKIDLGAMRDCLGAWHWLVLGMVLIFTQPIVGFIRWKWLLDVQKIHITYKKSFSLTMTSFFFNTFLPGATGGDLFKAYAISKKSEKTAAAVTTVILDRFTGLAGLLIVCAAAFTVNVSFIKTNSGIQNVAILMLAIFVFGIFVFSAVMSTRIMAFLKRKRIAQWKFMGRDGLVQLYKAVHDYRNSKKVLFFAVGISIISHIATIAGATCFAYALGITGLSFANYLLLVPMGLAFNAIPITPGGVGQGQTAFDYLFTRALPEVINAGVLGATMMTFIHMTMIIISIIGGLFYALGYHQLHDAMERTLHDNE